MNNLRIRALYDEDAPFILEWMKGADLNDFFRLDPNSVTEDSVLEFIENSRVTDSAFHFAVADKNDEYLGTVSLKNVDRAAKNAEFAIALRAKARGIGVGTFAVREVLRFAFETLRLHRVYLNVFADNAAAIRLYEKLGFVCEGEFRDHLYVMGSYKNLKWYGITEKEFKEITCRQ